MPGKVADRPGDRLRVDAVQTTHQISLPVQHLVPLVTFPGHPIPESAVALGRDPIEQQLQRRPDRAYDAERSRGAPAESARSSSAVPWHPAPHMITTVSA